MSDLIPPENDLLDSVDGQLAHVLNQVGHLVKE